MACLCSLSSHPSRDCLGLFTRPCQRCDIQVLFKLLLVLHLLTFHWPKQIILAQSGIKWEGAYIHVCSALSVVGTNQLHLSMFKSMWRPPPRWHSSKESASNAGDSGAVPGWGRLPGGGHSNTPWSGATHPVFLPGKSHDRGEVHSPQGCKESNTTEVTGHAWYGLPGVPFSILLHKKYWVPIVLISCCCYNKLLQT